MVAGGSKKSRLKRLASGLHESSHSALEQAEITDVLTELYILFEQYAPAWYTREHHEQIENALRILKKC